MTTLSRDQFKATKVADLKKQRDTEDKIVGKSGGKNEFIDIEEGTNKIRIAPKFPHEKDFYLMRMVHWGTIEKEGGDTVRVPILNSKIHGGTQFDLFEEYIALCKSTFSSDSDKMKLVTDWKTGISSTTTWWAYGWKIVKDQKPKFGVFEFKKSVRDQLNSLSIMEDEDEAIDLDPFTDVDNGKNIVIKYDSKKENKDKYKVQLSQNAFPLTDEMFEELLSKKSLTELLHNVYTMDDFERAQEAIRNFDLENEFDLFDSDEFQETLVKVRNQYSTEEKATEKASSKKPASKPAAKAKVEEDEDDEEEAPKKSVVKDKFTKMERDELLEYIGENEYEISVKKSFTDDVIRQSIRDYELAKATPVAKKKVVVEDDDDAEEEEDVDDAPVATTKASSRPSIEELRKKLKKQG